MGKDKHFKRFGSSPLKKKAKGGIGEWREVKGKKKGEETDEKEASLTPVRGNQFAQFAAGNQRRSIQKKLFLGNDRAATPPTKHGAQIAASGNGARDDDISEDELLPPRHKGGRMNMVILDDTSSDEADDSDADDDSEKEGVSNEATRTANPPAEATKDTRSNEESVDQQPKTSLPPRNPYKAMTTSASSAAASVEFEASGNDHFPPDRRFPDSVKRTYLRRVEMKVTTKGSTQSDVELIFAIKSVLAKIQEADKSFVVLPYCNADSRRPPPQGSTGRTPRYHR